MRTIFLHALFLFLIPNLFANNDILILNDQKAFKGKVLKIKDCTVTFRGEDQNKYFIPAEDIYMIQFENVKDEVYQAYLKLSPDDYMDKCMKGQTDASMYHGKTGAHIAMGLLFGPFAIIGAAVGNPSPYNGSTTQMMSKNKELFNDPDYLQCYKRKAKGRNVGNAAAGWGMWILLLLVIAGSAA